MSTTSHDPLRRDGNIYRETMVTRKQKHEITRAKIEADLEEFLAKGGKVEKIENGRTGYRPYSQR